MNKMSFTFKFNSIVEMRLIAEICTELTVIDDSSFVKLEEDSRWPRG